MENGADLFAEPACQVGGFYVIGKAQRNQVLPLFIAAEHVADQNIFDASLVQGPHERTADESRAAGDEDSAFRKISHSFLCFAYDQERRLYTVAHGIDSGTENQVLDAGVAVGGHDDEIGREITSGLGDFMGRTCSMAHDHVNV